MSQEVWDVVFITRVVCELIKVKLSSALSIFLKVKEDLDFDTGVPWLTMKGKLSLVILFSWSVFLPTVVKLILFGNGSNLFVDFP